MAIPLPATSSVWKVKMPAYKFKGLSKKNKDARIKAMLSQIRYPEERAQPLYYMNGPKDSPALHEEKKKRRADYDKQRTDELKKDLEAMDIEQHLGKYTFPKDKPVEIDELDTDIIAKLDELVKGGNFEKVEQKAKVEK